MRKSAGIIIGLGLLASRGQKEDLTAEPRPKVEMPAQKNKAPEKVEAKGVEQRGQERRVKFIAAALKGKIQKASEIQEELDASGDLTYQNRDQAWAVANGVQQLIETYVGPGEVLVTDLDGDDIPEITYTQTPFTHTIRLEAPRWDDTSSGWTLYVETEDSGTDETHSGVIHLQTGVPSEINPSLLTEYFNGNMSFEQD